MVNSPLLDKLVGALPGTSVVTDGDALQAYRHDEAPQVRGGLPAAVVLARTADEVAAALRVTSHLGVPVVPRGAGTGLSGGAAAVDGCVVLCTTRMDRILELNVEDQYAVVQAGVVTADLDAAAAEVGLWYPPDPSSWMSSTLGGNVATDAGGLCCVRHGTTSAYVLGVEVVLADGDLLVTGRRTPKGVAGYNLAGLMTGSEGTLGVITAATLRLRPKRPRAATVVAVFGSLEAAGATVLSLTGTGLAVSLLEIMDNTTLRAVDALSGMGLDLDAAALLVVQTEVLELHADIEKLCLIAGATEVHATVDDSESQMLLEARRLALPALQRSGSVLLDDVAVPRSALAALISSIEEIALVEGLQIGTFGHAGDGNLHPTIVYDGSDPEQILAARRAFDSIVAAALSLGGTITGEHGVGRLKPTWLTREISPVSLGVQRAIKGALDPAGLMNPGAVLPRGRGGA